MGIKLKELGNYSSQYKRLWNG